MVAAKVSRLLSKRWQSIKLIYVGDVRLTWINMNRNMATLQRYLEEQRANGIKDLTLKSDVWAMTKLDDFLAPKAFEDAEKEDLIKFFNGMLERLKASTIHLAKVRVKHFYAWLFECDPREYPRAVSWIRSSNPRSTKAKGFKTRVRPEDLVTDEEVLKLLELTDHPRDQAIIIVLYETGAEARELLNMKVKSVTLTPEISHVTLSIGEAVRRQRIRDSVPYLSSWLNVHPLKEDPEAPLWVTRQHGLRAMSYDNLHRVLVQAKKSASIKKPISAVWLRHACLTKMAKVLKNEQLLKKFAGWSPDSRMAAVYVHLSGMDLDEEMSRLYGETPSKEEEPLEGPLKPKQCPRCGDKLAPTHLFCPRCGQRVELGIEETVQLERDLFLNTYHEVLMEQREKKGAMGPDFYKVMDVVEERIKAKRGDQK